MIHKIKSINIKYIHIAIIIIGIIFISIPIFHTCLWFDESYSVAIANHSFAEIWTIGGHDVHPVLYYWLLHILNLIFGNNILVYRLFSMICMSILGIVGYTHIRKDFGEKAGLLFSFFVFFLPVNLVYTGEIRMYSLAMLLVTLTAIYAYRIYKNKDKINKKDWIIFGICSLSSAYTHYYGLIAIGIINLALMTCFIIQSIKAKKLTVNMKAFIIVGVTQIILYLPWIICLLVQIEGVKQNFWIKISFPHTPVEIFNFPFVGNLEKDIYVNEVIASIYGWAILLYVIYLYIKNKSNKNDDEKNFPGLISIGLYILVIICACIVSIIIKRPIIYARYLLCVLGIFIFFITYIIAKKGIKYINYIICVMTIIISIFVNVGLIKINYAKDNNLPFEYLKNNIEDTDLFLYGNDASGFVVSAKFPNNKSYFIDTKNWQTEKAFKAYGKDFETIYNLDALSDYHGRILIIGAGDYSILEDVEKQYNVKVLDKQKFGTTYREYQYTFALVEK